MAAAFFALPTEELTLEVADLAAKLFVEGFESAQPDARPEHARTAEIRLLAEVCYSRAADQLLAAAAR